MIYQDKSKQIFYYSKKDNQIVHYNVKKNKLNTCINKTLYD